MNGYTISYSALFRPTNQFVVGYVYIDDALMGDGDGKDKTRRMRNIERVVEEKFLLSEAQIFLIIPDDIKRKGFWPPSPVNVKVPSL